MSAGISIPRKLPLLLVTNEVLLPGSAIRIPVTTSQNMSMVKSRLLGQNTLASTIIGVLPKEPDYDLDGSRDRVAQIGTAAVVVQVTGTNWPRPSYTLLLSGLCRFRLDKLVMEQPYPVGVVTQLDRFSVKEDFDETNTELSSLIDSVRGEATKLLEMLDVSIPTVKRLKRMLGSVPGQQLADVCVPLVKASYAEKLQVLETLDLTERLKKILPLIMRQVEGSQMLQEQNKPFSRFPGAMTRVPRAQLVGNEDMEEGDDDLQELHSRLKAAKLPLQARKVAFKDLQRLRRLSPQSPEHGMLRTYIELMSELPWSRSSTETLDIHKSRKDLDADHYAMDKLKRRVLEYLAVRQLKNSLRGPILCFVGPPGVGKTSVGRSIANTLGREFSRISVGGICNQSDIRGHRRTYVGSMPGRIIQGLKTVGVNNPVFLLDEIDKMGSGLNGDPAAALLEVLDPEQNCNFVDHYLNVPFDLSQVMFLATANSTATIPPALLDRMEVIHVPGYTHEEKLHIAVRHLLPKQLSEHGLDREMMQLPEGSIKLLISKYTNEAGVRNLERKIGALCRAVAVKVAEMRSANTKDTDVETQSVELPDGPIFLDEVAIEDILGPALYDHELAGRMGQPGVAIGLAWTAAGGELMFVEASKMHGAGELTLTGQLGNVMKESARLALNWARMHASQYGVEVNGDLMTDTDVHIHFPAGAVGKDGPSAGVTIVTALMSLFSGRTVATDLAMTGEVTLSGLVLAVGGIKEKVLAAHRGGLRRVIIPKKNEKDLQEIPDNVKSDIHFILVTQVDEVLQAAFEGGIQMIPDSTAVGAIATCSTVVPSSQSSVEPTEFVVETPHKISKLFPAGLLPAFEMLLTRIKPGKDENVKQSDAVVRKLQFGSNPTSRLALSTIQAYGSIEPKPNLQVLAKPLLSQQKSSTNAKRPNRSVSPVQRKRAKTNGKLKSGCGHGIRKPKPPTKSDKNKQSSQSAKSSKPNSNSQLNLKLQAIKNKLRKDRVTPSDSNDESHISTEQNLETWGDDEKISVPLDAIIEKLDTCPDLQDIVHDEWKKDLFLQSDEEMNKINELIHIVQGDGNKEYLPSSPSHELQELVPIEKEKIQQVECLISKLLGEEDLLNCNNSPNMCEVLYGTNSESVEFSSGNMFSKSCVDIMEYSENSTSSSYINQSPCKGFNSPLNISQEYSMELDSLNEKLNQSNYIDPNDTDPFDDYENGDCSFIIEYANGSGDTVNLNAQKLTDKIEESGGVSEDTNTQETGCNCETSDVPSTQDYDGVNSSQCDGSDVSSTGTFHSAKSSPTINLTENKTPNKLFPLFEKGKLLEAKKSSPPTKLTQQRRNFPVQEKDGKEQLILDAGQKKFGMEVCSVCQFMYDPDVRKDVEAHFVHHNRHENQLRHLGWKNERVVADYGKDGYIIMVKKGDPFSWWKRVSTILETVNYDLGFAEDSKVSQTSKIFLYIWNKNIVGCIVSEHISQANRLLPGPQDLCTEELYPATCGIVRIWTSKTLRLKGFASKLMAAVMENFLMCRSLGLNEIAFSSPTPDGRAFATKYLGTQTFLVY